jgi:dTMP kinase
MTDTFAFMLDRAEHLEDTVRPALEEGRTVLSDRGHMSTYAYQRGDLRDGLAGRDPWYWLDDVYGPWNTEPDVTIYMDVSVETAAVRMEGGEKYESFEFLEDVRSNYNDLVKEQDHDVVIVDAEQPREDVVDEAVRKTRKVLDQ